MAEALLIIDYQNDFIPGGALAVAGGDEIADRVNELAADPRFDLVVATRDWHPPNHNSFAEQGGPWPGHLSSSVSSNMTSPSSVRCTGHLAAICMRRSLCSSGSSLGRRTAIVNFVGEPFCAGS